MAATMCSGIVYAKTGSLATDEGQDQHDLQQNRQDR
jgi:hypothetical protein